MTKITKRGQTLLGVVFVVAMLGAMATVGAIETQDAPTCADYEASQNWQGAWEKNCPFQNDNGDHLYMWHVG